MGKYRDCMTILLCKEKSMVEKAEIKGIDILCLFVGEPQERGINIIKEMYPGRALLANRN